MLNLGTEMSHRVTTTILEMPLRRCNFLKEICRAGFYISLHINVSVSTYISGFTWMITEQGARKTKMHKSMEYWFDWFELQASAL